MGARLFGPGRAELRAAQLPATDAEAQARRDQQTAAINARIRKLDTAQNAQITALEEIPDGPAAPAMRARIRTRFAELHQQRTQAETELDQLTAATPRAADPALLDELPYLGDILPDLPPALRARLFAAVRPHHLVEQDRRAGHRHRHHHRNHPRGPLRHHRPQPRRLPRHRQPRTPWTIRTTPSIGVAGVAARSALGSMT
jgi:hypothetical protein